MEFGDLKDVWRRTVTAGEPTAAGEREVEKMLERARELERGVRRRDRWETGVALALLPVFGWFAYAASDPLARIGGALVALSCVVIPIRLRMARRGAPDPGLPTAEFLRAELARVRAQSRLLGTVLWWYLAPLGLGVVLFFAGGRLPVWVTGLYAAVVAVFFAYLFRLNRRAVAEELGPRERELERLLGALAESAPSPRT